MPAYVDTMAFRGAVPWHNLGTRIEADWIGSAQLIAAAGLEWEATKVPVFHHSDRTDGPWVQVPGQFTIVRSDTGKSLGCTVGRQFEPFQNRELIALGDALCSEGEARWETAGSLHGGRVVWGLVQVAGSIDIRRRDGSSDVTAPFLLLNNAHDGSSHLRAMFTGVRVVCANTNGFALAAHKRAGGSAKVTDGQEVDGSELDVLARAFTSRHTSGIHDRAEEARAALGIAVQAMEEQRQTYQGLADAPMPMEAFGKFCAQLLTGFDDEREALEKVAEIDAKGGRSATILDRKGGELAQLFADARQGNRGEDRFDALNSVTDWIDHQRNRIAVHRATEDRLGIASKSFASGQFGSGAQTKRRALKLLTR